jgi:23S rRNA (cytosine1962-C5)-methyltransferase
VDRPAAGAERSTPHDPARWTGADLRFERDGPRGRWISAPGAFAPWTLEAGAFRLELRPTTSGEVGCYPEHAAVWAVVAAAIAAGRGRVLNLFAHTGGTTLAAAGAGGAVTHVDAARTAVTWARRNAALSDLAGAPVRWIIDDAAAFAAREARRGRIYDIVVADPPAYGHGTGAHRWHLAADLPALLASCRELGDGPSPPMLLLTSHSTALSAGDLADLVRQAWGGPAHHRRLEVTPLRLVTADGRALEAGTMIVAQP